MGRENSARNSQLRIRIAHLAARIIAEDGVDDFGYAKRKAARQVGAQDARSMPDNDEVEAALAEYRAIYQPSEHPAVLLRLREQALAVMRSVAQFRPHLTGSVLSGVAGKHSVIELQLFAESAKDVEIFLLNAGVRYRAAQARVYVNQEERVIPTYRFDHERVEVRLMVFDDVDSRNAIRTSPAGRPLERGSIGAVEALIAGDRGA